MKQLFARFRQWAEARRIRQITLERARLRVARGAAYLDDVMPGWYRQIDAATLELGDGRCCVLGQLHGDFRLGLGRSAILRLSSAPRANLSPVALGFLCVQDVPEAWQEQDYAHLNQAWREEVARRQPRRPKTPPAPAATREPMPVLVG